MNEPTPIAPVAAESGTPMTDSERAAILNSAVAFWVGQGFTVESVHNGMAVLSKPRPIGLLLNLLLVFFTGGVWLIWIIYRALNRTVDRVVFSVDEFGDVQLR